MPEISLDWLLRRCTQEPPEAGGCLVWKQQMNSGPITTIDHRTWKVRHLVWMTVHQRKPRRNLAPMPTVCQNEFCVHPDHLTLVKRNSHQVGTKTPLLHRLRTAQAKRAGAKLTEQQARDIRTSTEPLQALARRHGIAVSNVHRIRTGKAWIDYSGPFSQLTARNTP